MDEDVKKLADDIGNDVTTKVNENLATKISQMEKSIDEKLATFQTTLAEDLKVNIVKANKDSNPFAERKYINKDEIDTNEKALVKSILAAFDYKSENMGKIGHVGYNSDDVSLFPKKESINNKLAKVYGEHYTSKTMNVSDAAEGGYLVTPEVSSEIVPYLDNAVSFYNDIPTIVSNSGHIRITADLEKPTVLFAGELVAGKDSDMSFGDINLNTKRVVASITTSNQLLRYNTLANVQAWIQQKLIASLIPVIEGQMLKGDGVGSNFTGMYMTTPNKTNSAGATIANVYKDLNYLFESVMGANIMPVNGILVGSTRSYNYLKSLYDANEKRRPFNEDLKAGTLEGYKFYATNTVSNTVGTGVQSEVYFFDANLMRKAISRNISINVRPYGMFIDSAGATKNGAYLDTTTIDVAMEIDFAQLYAEASAVIEAVAWNH